MSIFNILTVWSIIQETFEQAGVRLVFIVFFGVVWNVKGN